jgi:hypothetical protein
MFTLAVSGNASLDGNPIGRRDAMPQIIVRADRRDRLEEGPIMLRERVNVSDFESDHFAAQLVERLGWAVNDASEVEEEASAVAEEEVAVEPEREAVPAS